MLENIKSPNELVEMRAIVSGDVQGVGFRFKTERLAKQLAIRGTVKNLSNGTVQVIAQGRKPALDKLLSRLQSKPGIARISNIEVSYKEIDELEKKFSVITS